MDQAKGIICCAEENWIIVDAITEAEVGGRDPSNYSWLGWDFNWKSTKGILGDVSEKNDVLEEKAGGDAG